MKRARVLAAQIQTLKRETLGKLDKLKGLKTISI
jgi:hypothetical protein